MLTESDSAWMSRCKATISSGFISIITGGRTDSLSETAFSVGTSASDSVREVNKSSGCCVALSNGLAGEASLGIFVGAGSKCSANAPGAAEEVLLSVLSSDMTVGLIDVI